MNTANVETIRQKQDRSSALRSTIKQVYIYVVLLLIVSIFSVLKLDQVELFGRGHFLSPDSIINLLRTAVPILTLSGAFTLLMISGYIDLSVGSAMSLSAVVFAWLILNGSNFFTAISLTLLLGIAMGFLNGTLVMKLRITPVIATLVTLSLFKGMALLIVPDGLSAIKSGELTFFSREHSGCEVHTYSAGQAFIDSGQGHAHIAANLSGTDNVELWATYFDVPPGEAFRLDAPDPEGCF